MSAPPQLLGVLAHELRTPIAAILGYQELLAEGVYGEVDARGKEPLERIAHAARQLLQLIDGVQEISAPHSALRQPVELIEPSGILRDCVQRSRDDASSRSVQLEADVPDALPELRGDRDRFCRAIDLALAAAIKTSSGASLRVVAEAQSRQLSISISNTGLSTDRDDPARISDPSSQTELTGPALRLAIARHIARGMNGDLELHRNESGTSIVITFA